MAEGGLTARCHCRRATIRLPRKPDYVNRCNCSLCTATGWTGMYFRPDEIEIAGEFDLYVRGDMPKPTLQLLRCRTCGTATHWTPLGEPPHERMGVNASLVEPAALEGVEAREIDGRSWPL